MKIYVLAFILSALIAVLSGFAIVPALKRLKIGQNILGYVEEHNYKSGTPTMGGVIFVFAAVVVFFLFSSGSRYLANVCVVVGLSYMAVGMIDDGIKVVLKRNEGLSALQKTLFEFAIATVVVIFAFSRGLTVIFIPFTTNSVSVGGWFIPLGIFVFLATTNSVNLTDGLDGLAGGVSYVYLLIVAVITLLQISVAGGNFVSSADYKNIALLEISLSGGVLGYLLFNTFKASVFMGDTGSLSLGGFIASCGILGGNVLFIPVVGITFVLSSVSVIIQVLHYKRTKKRIFLMAPLHHHFQHKGYAESKIVFAYKFATLLIGLICIVFYL